MEGEGGEQARQDESKRHRGAQDRVHLMVGTKT